MSELEMFVSVTLIEMAEPSFTVGAFAWMLTEEREAFCGAAVGVWAVSGQSNTSIVSAIFMLAPDSVEGCSLAQ
jgi:hypothetical protein